MLDYVREHGQDSETLNVIYVVDEQGALVDDIRIRELLLAAATSRVADLMDRRFVALKATDDQAAAVAVFRAARPHGAAGHRHRRHPHRHRHHRRRAGRGRGRGDRRDPEHRRFGSPRRAVHGHLVRPDDPEARRLADGAVFGEMLTATAMGAFEAEIERAVVLALFVPLIISSGGNSGSQASTLVIRALALGEVRCAIGGGWCAARSPPVWRSAASSAASASCGSPIWSAFSDALRPALAAGRGDRRLALVGIVLWGTLVGSLLPFILRRLGFDPATSSAPFVATLVDVTGLVIYFSVALLVLRGTLL